MAHITETAPDPARTSPKVKAAAATGGGLTVLALVLAAVLSAIPGEALAGLGPWALPVGAGITALATAAAAYAKSDPAREPIVVTETVAAPVGQDTPAADPADLVLTEDQAVTEPVVDGDPVARLAGQVGA